MDELRHKGRKHGRVTLYISLRVDSRDTKNQET